MVHMPYLGKGGTSLGINFGTDAVIIQNSRIANYNAQYEYTVYYETDEEGVPFVFPTINERWKTAAQENFSKIPGLPVAYWVSGNVYKCFLDSPKMSDVLEPRQGMATADNNRFLKFWNEVSLNKIGFCVNSREESKKSGKKWFPYCKGGSFNKWYGNNEYVVNWENDGEDIINFSGSVVRNPSYYFKKGLTWSSLTSGNISFRYTPNGFLFDSKGPICFLFNNEYIYYYLGVLNSCISMFFLKMIAPTLDFNQGPVGKLPAILSTDNFSTVNTLVEENINLSKKDWDSFETSWDFEEHPLV